MKRRKLLRKLTAVYDVDLPIVNFFKNSEKIGIYSCINLNRSVKGAVFLEVKSDAPKKPRARTVKTEEAD